LCCAAVGHFDEAKPTGAAGVTVSNEIDPVDCPIRLEEPAEVLICGGKSKVPNKNIHASTLLGESADTLARSSEQYAGANNARAIRRRNGEE
jgi:hypothetical protein